MSEPPVNLTFLFPKVKGHALPPELYPPPRKQGDVDAGTAVQMVTLLPFAMNETVQRAGIVSKTQRWLLFKEADLVNRGEIIKNPGLGALEEAGDGSQLLRQEEAGGFALALWRRLVAEANVAPAGWETWQFQPQW